MAEDADLETQTLSQIASRTTRPHRPHGPVPERLGDWPVECEIGRGGMGVVYRGRDPRLGRAVAIKVLGAELALETRHITRLRREAKALGKLNHPNIATLYALEEDGDTLRLVLEYIEGQTLAARLLAGPRDVTETLELGRQVADGLAAAHAAGFVHRDLKPGNLMIRPDGRLKMLDFGLAKSTSLEGDETEVVCTAEGALVGTPAYMSPEQALGKPVDAATDLWALGCVLYECLTGRRPFAGATAMDTLVAVVDSTPDWARLTKVAPAGLVSLIQTCLVKERAGRLNDAAELRDRLRALAGAWRHTAPMRVPHDLPRPRGELVGRATWLDRLDAAAREHRVVTLVGPGGSGKTRLALERAHRWLDPATSPFPDGVTWIGLTSLRQDAAVGPEVARRLGLRDDEAPVAAVAARLAGRRALLVLDNCEHVLEGARALVAALPFETRVLATSQSPLAIDEEHVLPLPPLALPEADERCEAVDLFLERARQANPGFAPGPADRAAAAEICRRVAGLPLAIELAAARVGQLPPTRIAEVLRQTLRVLATTDADVDARHRTLEAALEWSHGLLTDEAQVLLRRLAVFAGAFAPADAEAICADESFAVWRVAGALAELETRSWLVRDGERLRLLEPVRRHAGARLEQIGEADALRARHTQVFAERAFAAEAGARGEQQVEQLQLMDADYDDLMDALEGALRPGGDAAFGQRLATAPWRYWQARGRLREGSDWLERALALDDAPTVERARLLNVAANLASNRGLLDEAAERYREAMDIYRDLGDLRGCAYVTGNLANLSLERFALDEAIALQRATVRMFEELDDSWCVAAARSNLGMTLWAANALDEARAENEHALFLARRQADRQGVVVAALRLAVVLADTDELDGAAALFEEALQMLGGLGARQHECTALEWLARAASRAADPTVHPRAAQMLGASDSARAEIDWPLSIRAQVQRAPVLARLREALGAERFEQAHALGAALAASERVDEARRLAVHLSRRTG